MGFSRPESSWHSESGTRLTRLRTATILLAFGALLLLNVGQAMALTLTSSAFAPGEKIPSKYTCEGDNLSPPLAFTGVPDGTKSLALIVDDPDVPDPKAPKRIWSLPSGAVTGLNDRKKASYQGPCPPIGRHRYFHKLYALDIALPAKQLTKFELEAAMKDHVLAQAELIGTYQKGDP